MMGNLSGDCFKTDACLYSENQPQTQFKQNTLMSVVYPQRKEIDFLRISISSLGFPLCNFFLRNEPMWSFNLFIKITFGEGINNFLYNWWLSFSSIHINDSVDPGSYYWSYWHRRTLKMKVCEPSYWMTAKLNYQVPVTQFLIHDVLKHIVYVISWKICLLQCF